VVLLAKGLDLGVLLYVGQLIYRYYCNPISEGVTTTKNASVSKTAADYGARMELGTT
jgi:hypothetical protein